MKIKILISAILIAISCTHCLAQIQSKTILLGANVQYSTYTDPGQSPDNGSTMKYSTVDFSMGRALNQNRVAGITLSFIPKNEVVSNSIAGLRISKATGFSGGLFYRRYKTLGKGFYFFGEANAFYAKRKETHSMEANSYKFVNQYSTVGLDFTPGVSYQVIKKLQVEMTLPNMLGISYLNIREK